MKKLILLAGQSNMSGRDIASASDLRPIPNVSVLGKDGIWREAIEPLTKDRDCFTGTFRADGTRVTPEHSWENIPPAEGEIVRGVGPGRTFARLLHEEHPDWEIGLLPCSVGGTPISAWFPCGVDPSHPECHPYDEALALARQAIAEGGEIIAILWHQGESDATRRTENYADLLQAVIRNFRRDLAQPALPFLMGELAAYYNSSIREGATAIDEAMHAAASAHPGVAVVSCKDFSHKGDSLHFSADSAHLFGARLYAAYRRLQDRPLPKIVLLGDSIRLGYDRYVREHLYGRAEVLFPGENCAFAQNVLRRVDLWKKSGSWGDDVAIVHWNAGLWDTLHLDNEGPLTPLPVYEDFIARIHRRLRVHFPSAKLVFATSTPVLENGFPAPLMYGRFNADIEAYNAAARRVLEPQGSAINDLYALMKNAPETEHSDATHWYTPGGTERLGNAVLQTLTTLLS